MVTLGQIGCGYWGPNLVRNFNSLQQVRVKTVAELSAERIAYVKEKYPSVRTTGEYNDILTDKEIDAVVVATPAKTHYQLVKKVLENGKHCLVEKPLAMTAREGEELCALAQKNGLVLMVGHTFLYNAAVRMLKKLFEEGTVGEAYYVYAQRLNLGIVRSDINVMWNLAPHDVSILLYVLGQEPLSVSAHGVAYIQKEIEDIAFLRLTFPGHIMAYLHLSWLDPNKTRRITVVGSKKMIVYDDVAEAKIQIYDKGIDKKHLGTSMGTFDDFGKFQLIHRAGDIVFPKFEFTEPLKTQAEHFVNCIIKQEKPLTDGTNGLLVTKILEAAQTSLMNNGAEVSLKD